MKSAVQAASEKGASCWVTALPSYENNCVLHKSDFVDAMCIRYGWTLPGLPTKCKCDKADFSLQHALDCPLGGYRTIQHNDTRDEMAKIMREAGLIGVEVKPKLQPLSGKIFDSKQQIRITRPEVILSVQVFGKTCDRLILM